MFTAIHKITQLPESELPGVKEKVLFLYSMGMDLFKICEQMYKLYGIELPYQQAVRITDSMEPELKEWQSRPLKSVYPFLFMDYFPYQVKDGTKIVTRNACTLLGITAKGYKEILSIRTGADKKELLCRNSFQDLKRRGVQDILLFSVPKPLEDACAISTVYPDTGVYPCMIRLLQDSSKYVSSKDRKAFLSDCRSLTLAQTSREGYFAFLTLKEKWNNKYPFAVSQWESSLPLPDSYFLLPDAMRGLMCSTGILKGLQDQYQRTCSSRFICESDSSMEKTLYIAARNISQKWTQHFRGWDQVFKQLVEQYGERLTGHL